MMVMNLIPFLMIIMNGENQGGTAFASFIKDTLKAAMVPLLTGKARKLCRYARLRAEDAKVCKNGERKHCIRYDWMVAQNRYFLYTSEGDHSKSPRRLYVDKLDEIIESHQFSPDKNLVFLIVGLTATYQRQWVQKSKNALLAKNVNVIALDYKSHGDYFLIAYNNGLIPLAEAVGEKLGKLIKILMNKGWSGSRIHVVGHSLGSHIAAFAAKYLKTVELSVARITALDPVGRVFNKVGPKRRLNERDAEFVDCIYTDFGGKIGAGFPYCGANYFVNCPIEHQRFKLFTEIYQDLEKHFLVTDYFAESINLNHVFEAKKCDGIPRINVKICKPSFHKNTIKMGYPASPKELGYFFVKTNAKYPYAKKILRDPHMRPKRKRKDKQKSHKGKKRNKSKSSKARKRSTKRGNPRRRMKRICQYLLISEKKYNPPTQITILPPPTKWSHRRRLRLLTRSETV